MFWEKKIIISLAFARTSLWKFSREFSHWRLKPFMRYPSNLWQLYSPISTSTRIGSNSRALALSCQVNIVTASCSLTGKYVFLRPSFWSYFRTLSFSSIHRQMSQVVFIFRIRSSSSFFDADPSSSSFVSNAPRSRERLVLSSFHNMKPSVLSTVCVYLEICWASRHLLTISDFFFFPFSPRSVG